MVKAGIAVFLFFYLLGSPPLQPYLPPIMDTATNGFHVLVNRTVWNVTRPVYATVTGPFRSEKTTEKADS